MNHTKILRRAAILLACASLFCVLPMAAQSSSMATPTRTTGERGARRKAHLVSHADPGQMMRLVFALQPPHDPVPHEEHLSEAASAFQIGGRGQGSAAANRTLKCDSRRGPAERGVHHGVQAKGAEQSCRREF